MRKFARNNQGGARNSARVLWKTDEHEHVFVSLSICVAHARHGSHVRYLATYTIYAACVTSISEAVVARATFRGLVAKKNRADDVAQQRRRARAQARSLSLALIYSYYTHILLSARVLRTFHPQTTTSIFRGVWEMETTSPKKASNSPFKISNRIRMSRQALCLGLARIPGGFGRF